MLEHRAVLLAVKLIVCVSLCVCVGLQAQTADAFSLPGWFWEMPDSAGISCAVGYARVYYDLKTSFEKAFINAAWRLLADTECRVFGERGTIRAPDGMLSMGQTFKIMVDSARFDPFAQSLVRIDSFASRDLVVMLVGTAEVPVKRERMAMPPVLDSGGFATKGTIVATGSSPAYYYESTSWEAAEKNARLEAALSLYARIRGLEGHIPGQDVQTLVIETDVVLRNVQTIARAIDSETGERTVFLRVPCGTTPGP